MSASATTGGSASNPSAAAASAVAAIASCSSEITDLHVFFVNWFTGSGFASDADADAAFDAFLDRFSNDFHYVTTGGNKIGKPDLAGMHAARGSNPDFVISTVEHELAVVPRTDGRIIAGVQTPRPPLIAAS